VRWAVYVLLAAWVATAGCARSQTPSTFRLDGKRLMVTNTTSEDWTDVEVWLNTYYRVTAPSLSAGGRMDVPLGTFVAGFGQRFDFAKAQIVELHLTARRPDGQQVTIRMPFEKDGLSNALDGLGGKR
jgi:hypothetical protein